MLLIRYSRVQVLLTTQGSDLVSKLLKMQQLEDEEELAYNAASQDDSQYCIITLRTYIIHFHISYGYVHHTL